MNNRDFFNKILDLLKNKFWSIKHVDNQTKPGRSRKLNYDDNCVLVSSDLLYLAFQNKFSKTQNENSRILNFGCENITFQVLYAKEIEITIALGHLKRCNFCLYAHKA